MTPPCRRFTPICGIWDPCGSTVLTSSLIRQNIKMPLTLKQAATPNNIAAKTNLISYLQPCFILANSESTGLASRAAGPLRKLPSEMFSIVLVAVPLMGDELLISPKESPI